MAEAACSRKAECRDTPRPRVGGLEPSESVATTYSTPPAGGPGGVMKVNPSGVILLTGSGLTPSKATVVPGVAKSDPETVTDVPPFPVPDEGVSEVIDGRANV